MGPIAKALVRKTAVQCSSANELYRKFAERIPDKNAATAFLRRADHVAATEAGASAVSASRPAPTAATACGSGVVLDPETRSRTESSLVRYLGPVAGVLIAMIALQSTSLEDFHAKLAARIPNEAERAEFLAAQMRRG